jgi:hypothetical protein
MEQATGRARDVPSKQVLVEMRNGEMSKQKPYATESVTTMAMTDDDGQRDTESFADSYSNSSDSSSCTAEAMRSSSSTRQLEVIPSACDDEDDTDNEGQSPAKVCAHQQAAENNEVKLNVATGCEATQTAEDNASSLASQSSPSIVVPFSL